MGRKRKANEERRVGRKDLPDPNRDVRDPRKGDPEGDTERRDPDAGTGQPVQLAGAPPADLDWPQPSKDAPAEK
jgi:hypothetical protein